MPFVGLFRLPVAFKPFPTSGTTLPTLDQLVEISGFVKVDRNAVPSSPLFVLAIRPRLGASKKLYPTFLAPQNPFDRVALRALFSTGRLVMTVHPADGKPKMIVACLSPESLQSLQNI